MSQQAYETSRLLQENMERVLLGKPEVVRLIIIALLAGEHILLEDVPGVGKTLAAKALAHSVSLNGHDASASPGASASPDASASSTASGSSGGRFARLQFTPDLLPSDITGSMLYRNDTREFEFSPGPIFANVILADEINRAPPRTQSALLEAMAEGQVSADGVTRELPKPFIVVATQNPFEFEGTYTLPESQMDRFLLRTSIGYPDRQNERLIMDAHRSGEPVDALSSVVDVHQILSAQSATRETNFDESLVEYLLQIVEKTRNYDGFQIGVSTRAALSYYRACQARAVTDNRNYVTPDDIKALAVPVLSHRVLTDGVLQDNERLRVEKQIAELLQQVPVPV